MTEDTLAKIEEKIHAAAIGDTDRRELLRLLSALKLETAALKKNSAAKLENQKMLKHSVDELRSSVEGFEQSHPRLVEAVNSVSNLLSSLGI
jgi:Domain of unknown function (DUF4404)